MLHSARLFAMVLLLALAPASLIYSAAVAQDSEEHPDGYYPTLTAENIAPCRPQIAKNQQDFLELMRADAADYSPSGPYADAKTYSAYLDDIARVAAQDPVSWFEKGADLGEGVTIGVMKYNEYYDEQEFANLAKGLWQDGSSRNNDDPKINWTNVGHPPALEKCIAGQWLAAFNAMHPELSQPAKSPTFTSAQVEQCTNDMFDLVAASQNWPGEVLDKAERLGKMEKDMFAGRCAKHPDAARYIAEAENMMGPEETAKWKPGGGDYIVPTRAELAAASAGASGSGSPGGICVGTPEDELVIFNAEIETIRAAHPQPGEDAGARANYSWTYAFALVGLEKIKPHRECLGKYYSPNFDTLEGMRVSAKKGCKDLSSVGGDCPVDFN